MKDFAILTCLLAVLFFSLTSACHIAAVEAVETSQSQNLVPGASTPKAGGAESNQFNP